MSRKVTITQCCCSCCTICLKNDARCVFCCAAGTIEGDVRVGGHPKVQKTFARVMGYVEQTDIHSPNVSTPFSCSTFPSLCLVSSWPFRLACSSAAPADSLLVCKSARLSRLTMAQMLPPCHNPSLRIVKVALWVQMALARLVCGLDHCSLSYVVLMHAAPVLSLCPIGTHH